MVSRVTPRSNVNGEISSGLKGGGQRGRGKKRGGDKKREKARHARIGEERKEEVAVKKFRA